MIPVQEKENDFFAFLQSEGEYIQKITLSKPTKEATSLRVHIKRINLNFFVEEFTKTQTFHKNLNHGDLIEYMKAMSGVAFKNIYVRTQKEEVHVLFNKKGKSTLLKKALLSKTSITVKSINNDYSDSQNRTKKYLIQEGVPVSFLVHLGIMNSDGKVLASKYDKFKQINRFVEFISDVLATLPNKDEISIIDYGCGKSYLTFAVYHFLQLRNITPHIIGLDLKEEVVAFCSKLAKQCEYSGLDFFCGDIASFTTEKSIEAPDLVISLHACDTATDYALAQAVHLNAKAILAVPCCQHEINAQLNKADSDSKIRGLLEYGIIKERFASLATDVLRAQLLESCGYSVQILEFIDSVHTPKNLLIRAIKKQIKNYFQRTISI